ncbi:g11124 [Coccomyxa viridis]|uniref:G11124 protein n=1 Tax=Coccomyxa viridis TaxID=1274662 RepID=A0ABP1GE70_9CHLO
MLLQRSQWLVIEVNGPRAWCCPGCNDRLKGRSFDNYSAERRLRLTEHRRNDQLTRESPSRYPRWSAVRDHASLLARASSCCGLRWFKSSGSLLGSLNSRPFGTLDNILPASKADFHYGDAALQAEVTDLQAENVKDEALLNNVILQVNKLTPV